MIPEPDPKSDVVAQWLARKPSRTEKAIDAAFLVASILMRIVSAVGLAAALVFNLALIAGCAYGVYASFQHSTTLGLVLLLPGVVLCLIAVVVIWREG